MTAKDPNRARIDPLERASIAGFGRIKSKLHRGPSQQTARESQPAFMKCFSTWLLILFLAPSVLAQTSRAEKASHGALVEGIVTKDPDGEPVKKVLIELIAENQSEAGNYTALTGADGTFAIQDILPGRYRLFAERTGLLDSQKSRGRSDGRLLTLNEGQELKDVHVKLQAAAVVRGRVTDEDGDPLPNAEVSILRATFASGRRRWEQAGSERTNDLGEYRIAGLAAGNVYVSVNPPPDFQTLIEDGGSDQKRNSARNPATSYQTLYYPGTTDRSQATPIQLHPGDDFPVNFSMAPSPSLSIRGAVVNLPPKTSATIMLQSRDFSLIMNGAEMHKDGSFVIRNVSPGNYTIVATVDGAPMAMTARQSLQLAATNVEGLRLAPQPGATVRGHLRFDNQVTSSDLARIFLTLQTMNGEDDATELTIGDRFTNIAHINKEGMFEWTDVPAGNYYVQILGETDVNEGWFVKSAFAGGRESEASGFAVNGGMVALDLVASHNGAIVEGLAMDTQGQPAPNAIIVAVPGPQMQKRPDYFRKTVSDQGGHFTLRGIRAGDYSVLAWENVEGDSYYNPDFLKSYEGQGTALRVNEGERKSLQLNVIAATAESD